MSCNGIRISRVPGDQIRMASTNAVRKTSKHTQLYIMIKPTCFILIQSNMTELVDCKRYLAVVSCSKEPGMERNRNSDRK